jgi:hypothetical protein
MGPAYRWLLSLVFLSSMGGCAHAPPEPPVYVLPARPDDVHLFVRGLHYQADTSGYTFKYNERDPSDPSVLTRWVCVRKDSFVAVRNINHAEIGGETTWSEVWLRRDWDEPPKAITKEELQNIPALPAKRSVP